MDFLVKLVADGRNEFRFESDQLKSSNGLETAPTDGELTHRCCCERPLRLSQTEITSIFS